jgi:hypothetical protein
MGAVLRARDLDLGRIVALKILPPDMAADPENIIRFKQEARAAAKLDHDNIARVYFFGEDQGLHFIAFEFVEGDNLRQLMDANGGTIPVPDAVALMLQVTAGLSHAAERSVVHRDIKPSNIIVTPDGKAKIVDMGLARSLDARHGQLTESGVTLGTFDYISPEQAIEPRSADVRSDLYSLGCTFYHALTGHPPVPDGTAAKKLDAQKHIMPPDPRAYNSAIPVELAAILGRMMAKDPDRRYQHPDHLAAHLRSVARKLGIPSGPVPATGPAFEEPLPPPPKMSVGWVLTAGAVMALALAIFLNTFGGGRPQGPSGPGDSGNAGTEPVDPSAAGPVAAGARDAANTEELVSLLRQGATNIRLTGADYDLSHFRDRDGHPVEAVLSGDDVRLDGAAGATVKLGYMPTDGKTRLNSLTLRGHGRGKAQIRKVRFVVQGRGEAQTRSGESGVAINGFDRVTVEECTFTSNGISTGHDGPAALALALKGGIASLLKCYFGPGCVGLEVNGPGQVGMGECAIAPQHAGVRVTRTGSDAAGETDLSLNHCTALMTNIGAAVGAVVEVDNEVPCVVHSGHCLFAGPDRSLADEAPVVFRQLKTAAPETKYEGEPETRPNTYFRIAAYSDADGTYTFADAPRDKFVDTQRPIKHPWKDRDPLALLVDAKPADPLTAFKQDLRLPELRVKEDPKGSLIGAQYVGWERLYPVPLPSPEESRDATVKIWDPSLPETAEDLPPGVFPTLGRAVAALRSGDTLLIRYTGRLDVDEQEFKKKDFTLTIKPDAGHNPVLVPIPPKEALKRPQAMFKLYGGPNSKLVLDGLHFRLPADRAPAVAVLPGGGQLEIRNSVITMEDGEELAAVTLTDPRGEMMMMGAAGTPINWPLPKVTIDKVFLRGKGRLLNVKGSRPFELEVKNVLAAVDDSLIDIEPSTADPSSAGSGIVRLNRVTAYLGGSLLNFRASERKGEMAPAGLARTEVIANDCVFTPAGSAAEPFVRAGRLDSRDQADKWFGYRGKNNVYGYDKKKVMLELRPADVDAMPITVVDGDRWLEKTLEPADPDPFTRVHFRFGDGLPAAGNPRLFAAIRPKDFGQATFEPAREGSPEVGAPADVPDPFGDEDAVR